MLSKLLTLGSRNEKENKKLIEMIPLYFPHSYPSSAYHRAKNILHTNCIALHMTPYMANITQKHGYMKKQRLLLELDIIKYMYGHMTAIPRY